MQASSASRMFGLKLPMRSRWVPGAKPVGTDQGAVEKVAQLMMSARRAASLSEDAARAR